MTQKKTAVVSASQRVRNFEGVACAAWHHVGVFKTPEEAPWWYAHTWYMYTKAIGQRA